ncbi:hypothetical protein pb186bvf_009367 [Paramecium bursaria]
MIFLHIQQRLIIFQVIYKFQLKKYKHLFPQINKLDKSAQIYWLRVYIIIQLIDSKIGNAFINNKLFQAVTLFYLAELALLYLIIEPNHKTKMNLTKFNKPFTQIESKRYIKFILKSKFTSIFQIIFIKSFLTLGQKNIIFLMNLLLHLIFKYLHIVINLRNISLDFRQFSFIYFSLFFSSFLKMYNNQKLIHISQIIIFQSNFFNITKLYLFVIFISGNDFSIVLNHFQYSYNTN